MIPLARRIVNDLSCCLAPLHIIQRSSTSTRSIWYQCRFRFCASSITCRFSAVRTPGNACAAMGCVLPCRNQIPKRMASLCSACATVGCALPSSQAHALERRYPAVRAPLWAAHCRRCIRMLKNFVASERLRLSAVRPPLWAAHCLCRIRMPMSSQCRCACAAVGRALPSMHPNAAEFRCIRRPKTFGSASAAVDRVCLGRQDKKFTAKCAVTAVAVWVADSC